MKKITKLVIILIVMLGYCADLKGQSLLIKSYKDSANKYNRIVEKHLQIHEHLSKKEINYLLYCLDRKKFFDSKIKTIIQFKLEMTNLNLKEDSLNRKILMLRKIEYVEEVKSSYNKINF